MFVFKVAVVGAGGADVAKAIEAAGIEVVHQQGADGLGDVDFVIEAAEERIEAKLDLFAELDACTPARAILATTSSGLSISEIADATSRPHQVVGFRVVGRIAEIAEGDETAPETMQVAANLAQAIRRTPVRCAECPGLVVDRIRLAAAAEQWREGSEDAPEADDATIALARLMVDAYGDRFFVPERSR